MAPSGDSVMHVARQVVSVFFEYDTPRIVHIKSKKVGIINRFLQLCIIGYVIGYAIVWNKGYQEFDTVRASVTTKLKGVVRTTINGEVVVMDVADYVVPPQENNALFVTTNMIQTDDQVQSICPESPRTPDVSCTMDADCPANTTVFTGHGVRTGQCNTTTATCMIYAWCPVEKDERPEVPVLEGSKNFTVFIKNNIEFTKFGVKKRNLPENSTDEYLQKCPFMQDGKDPFCPIFVLGNMVEATGATFESMAEEGGVVEILIEWNCNLDFSLDDCVPVYEFRRLDKAQYKIAKGYNFRYATYYRKDGRKTRTLTKAYGIYFIINVRGRAGKFSFVPLLLNVGSGMALLVLATVVCDVILLYVIKSREFYYKKKYLTVTGKDAFQILNEDVSSREEGDDKGENSASNTTSRELS